MVAVDAEDRKEKPLPLIRMTARIEPEWLIDLFPDRVKEQSSVVWNHTAERVDAVSEMRYDELVIQESRGAAPDAEMRRRSSREESDWRLALSDSLTWTRSLNSQRGSSLPDSSCPMCHRCARVVFGAAQLCGVEKSGGGFGADAGAEDGCAKTA